MSPVVLTSGVAVVELGGLIALGVLLIISRHQLKQTRTELERSRQSPDRTSATATGTRAVRDQDGVADS